jgi:3-oxoacyl-[acyl-carrier-protein] synthase-3
VASELGQIIPIGTWAEWACIPDRGKPGMYLDGNAVATRLGIQSKAWSPTRFSSLEPAIDVGRRALEAAGLGPDDVDACVVVTCTPFQLHLNQDAFEVARGLGLPDDVPSTLLQAGCGGLARTFATAARSNARRTLVVAFNATSRYMLDHLGGPNEIYRDNPMHPRGKTLWYSPALFSDAAAAVVLERTDDTTGHWLYARDTHSFGDEPGFDNPLVEFRGGGAEHPPGTPSATTLAAFSMDGDAVLKYYTEGMRLNHQALLETEPELTRTFRRLYTHQASPGLVAKTLQTMGLGPEFAPTHAQRIGNVVTASTLCLLSDDVASETVRAGDRVCFSVVGAGPERGAFTIPWVGSG